MTIGCASWTIQPTVNNCPTAPPNTPSSPSSVGSDGGGASASDSSPNENTETGNSSPTSPPPALPTGATIITGTVGGQMITETFVPTTYGQFTAVTGIITTRIVDLQGTTMTVVVGPSGVAWAPFNQPTSALAISPPSALPSAAGNSQASSQSGASSQPGQTVVTGTVGSQTITEIFVPTIISALASLASTITSTTTDAQSSIETIVIGPGGLAWTPLSKAPSGVAQLNPPTIPPGNINTAFLTQAGSSPTITSAPHTGRSSSVTASAAAQSSASGAFDDPNQSETTIIVGGTTLHYSKETIQSLSTITAPTTITTPM